MKYDEYLEKYQPFIYNTFINSLKFNKVSQAYLIKGSDGTPTLDIALFLAKTLICEEPSPLACSSCLNCIRFEEGNYADFMLIDGSKNTIKVGDIENLQKFLSSSSLEKQGKKIYIINRLENANKEAVNALLKTLEEPTSSVYAFITTQNEAKILPTIISRCQILSLLPINKSIVKQNAINEGVLLEDADILSYFYCDVEVIKQKSEEENYKEQKKLLYETLNALTISSEEAIYYAQTNLIKNIKTKEDARLYIDLLSIAFKDILHIQNNQPLVLEGAKEQIDTLSKKYKNVSSIYLEIMLSRGQIEDNVNLSLLLQHIFIYIRKEGGSTYGRN
ncbi:MAG: hypothetical protein MR674_03080 [Erysipelotrichaceae bacterium]|nr:hypothetical protein [Erysipelotrichaceae bacterium]MDY6141386.1 hypothetical protein [Bacilli bacterium]